MKTQTANHAFRTGNKIIDWIGHGNLIAVLAWIPVMIFARHSDFACAVALAATLCFGLAWTAYSGDYIDKWTRSMAWRVRIGAAVAGGWLFFNIPSLSGRIAAAALYVVLYVVCERAVWHRSETIQAPAV